MKHYAGDVKYDIDGFVAKNMDSLFHNAVVTLSISDNPILQSMFKDEADSQSVAKRPATSGTQFKRQVETLMEKLYACKPHYVRCIKPNEERKPSDFKEDIVVNQVR